jgi:hypothetical protein
MSLKYVLLFATCLDHAGQSALAYVIENKIVLQCRRKIEHSVSAEEWTLVCFLPLAARRLRSA